MTLNEAIDWMNRYTLMSFHLDTGEYRQTVIISRQALHSHHRIQLINGELYESVDRTLPYEFRLASKSLLPVDGWSRDNE